MLDNILGFKYKVSVYNKETRAHEWHPYSIRYDTVEIAQAWYNLHGRDLEKMFNRELTLKVVKKTEYK